jgi:hypothetical protein
MEPLPSPIPIPSLFDLAMDPAVEQIRRDAAKIDQEYEASLAAILAQQRGKCLYSQEKQDLQRAELALA